MSSSNQVGVVLVGEEEVELVDPVDANSTLYSNSMFIRRPGRFLEPRAISVGDGGGLPLVQPLLREAVSRGLLKTWPPKVLFPGWSSPTTQWSEWVWKLRPQHKELWVESGVHDGVVASTCEFQRDDAAMFALLECWCPETNTFVLPWPSIEVEATVTLEDIMVLGGFSVVGEPVGPAAPPPAGETGELLGKLAAAHRSLRERCRSQRVSHAEWIGHHMHAAAGGGQLEHAAFLALWLSMFVFPGSAVKRSVFPLAARLALGTRLALAPAVLASLYRDLRQMKQQALAEGIYDGAAPPPIVVWAPFQILQLWAWERFVPLRPEKTPRFLHWNDPRAARWRCSDANTRDLPAVRSVLESPGQFLWRPYAENVDDWGRPSYYKQVGRWFVVGAGDDGDLPSLLHCLRAGELVGFGCVERYCPHRVAMQFGLDQDLPGRFPHADAAWELTWAAYERGTHKAKFYVPSHFCKPRAAKRFLEWQKEWRSARMIEVEKITVEQAGGVWNGQQLNSEGKHYSSTTVCTRSETAWKASIDATSSGEQPASLVEEGTWTNKLSSAYTEKETQDNGDCEPMEVLTSNGSDGEGCSGNQVDSSVQRSTEDLVVEDSEDSDYERFIIQELEKVDPPCKSAEKCKRAIDDALQKQKDLEFDREIQKLKAEIAELEDRLTKLQSETNVQGKEWLF